VSVSAFRRIHLIGKGGSQMKAIDLYYQQFKGTTLADLYRDKIAAQAKAVGYKCSDDDLLNFVDYKTEQLILLFADERHRELFSSGVLREAVLYLLIPRLDEAIQEFNDIGVYQTFCDIIFFLRAYVEVALIKNPKTFYPEEESLGSVHAREALKSLALLASWVPDQNVTDRHREFRCELLVKAHNLAEKVSVIFQNKKRNTKALRREYQDFKYHCIELIFMRPAERFSK
jgi:hypothetical protein